MRIQGYECQTENVIRTIIIAANNIVMPNISENIP